MRKLLPFLFPYRIPRIVGHSNIFQRRPPSFVPPSRMNYPLGDFSFSLPPPSSRGPSSWTSRSSSLHTVFNQRPFVSSAKSLRRTKRVYRGIHFFFSPRCFLELCANVSSLATNSLSEVILHRFLIEKVCFEIST